MFKGNPYADLYQVNPEKYIEIPISNNQCVLSTRLLGAHVYSISSEQAASGMPLGGQGLMDKLVDSPLKGISGGIFTERDILVAAITSTASTLVLNTLTLQPINSTDLVFNFIGGHGLKSLFFYYIGDVAPSSEIEFASVASGTAGVSYDKAYQYLHLYKNGVLLASHTLPAGPNSGTYVFNDAGITQGAVYEVRSKDASGNTISDTYVWGSSLEFDTNFSPTVTINTSVTGTGYINWGEGAGYEVLTNGVNTHTYGSGAASQPVLFGGNITFIQVTSTNLIGADPLPETVISADFSNNKLTTFNSADFGMPNLTELDISNNQITALTAIGFYTLLSSFNCSANSLTTLPLLPASLTEVDASANSITTVDLRGLINLVTLSLAQNQIATLDASQLTDLTALETLALQNNLLTAFSMSGFASLGNVSVGDNPGLTTLDLSNNALFAFDISNDTSLTDLNLSDNAGLVNSLDLTSFTALVNVNLGQNQFPSVVVTGLTSLQILNVGNNALTGAYDFTSNTALVSLNVSGNAITSVNIGGITTLESADVSSNQIDTLTFAPNVALTTLNAAHNLLTGTFDITTTPSLINVYVGYNPGITGINAGTMLNLQILGANNCDSLASISANNCVLSGIDITSCMVLLTMNAAFNEISSAQVNNILADLVAQGINSGTVDIHGQTPAAPPTGQGIVDAAALVTAGWSVTTD